MALFLSINNYLLVYANRLQIMLKSGVLNISISRCSKSFRRKSDEEIEAMMLRKQEEARVEEERKMKLREDMQRQREESQRKRNVERENQSTMEDVAMNDEKQKHATESNDDGEL